MQFVFCLYIFVFGLVIGSFLNVVIYRVPLGISVVKGRSFCPTCSHSLSAADLVPVFSFLFLRGKCRHCGAKIGVIYPLVELLTGVLFLLTYLRYGFSMQTLIYILIFPCLICIAFIDAHHGIIPDRFQIIMAVLALIFALLNDDKWIDPERFIGLFALSIPTMIIAIFGGIGFGDVKLFAIFGFLLGWKLILTVLLFSSVSAAVYSLCRMAVKKADRKTAIPYGPFIAAAAGVCMLYGNDILNLYFGLFQN